MEERKYGFIALWKHADPWYAMGSEDRKKFIDKVNEINREAQEKGVWMSDVYDCSWSSEYRFFSFWESPTIEIIQETLEKLVACGDVNYYNIQRHFIGRAVPDSMNIDAYDPDYLK